MNRADLFSETNSLVAMTVQIDPWLSAKPRTNPNTPSKAIPAQLSMLAAARPDPDMFTRNSLISATGITEVHTGPMQATNLRLHVGPSVAFSLDQCWIYSGGDRSLGRRLHERI